MQRKQLKLKAQAQQSLYRPESSYDQSVREVKDLNNFKTLQDHGAVLKSSGNVTDAYQGSVSSHARKLKGDVSTPDEQIILDMEISSEKEQSKSPFQQQSQTRLQNLHDVEAKDGTLLILPASTVCNDND